MEVETIPCKNVDELFSILDPTKPEWTNWFFRGQPNAKYNLIPSVWREDKKIAFQKFKKKIKNEEMNKLSGEVDKIFERRGETQLSRTIFLEFILYLKFENYMLWFFYETSNHAGLNIGGSEFHKLDIYNEEYWYSSKTDWAGFEQLISYYHDSYKAQKHRRFLSHIVFPTTLPQHYGLPTRSLDWTMDCRKAIFFAAYYFLFDITNKSAKKISIYAIKENAGAKRSGPNPIQLETKQVRYKNKFLHAQDGLFTTIHGNFFFLINGKWPSIEDLYGELDEQYFELKKIEIDSRFCEEILRRLQQCGISISRMMPSYNHVAQEVVKKLGFA